MRKPLSVPTDGNSRRLVVQPMTIEWAHRGQPHRMTIEPWGTSYEPSVPRLWPLLNWAMLTLALPVAVYTGWAALWVVFGVWAALMLPTTLIGVMAPRHALGPVSAAHDYVYRREGHVEYEALMPDGHWRPSDYMTRSQADAIMRADADDPLWLRWAAWTYVRAVGWVAWDGWDEWAEEKVPLS